MTHEINRPGLWPTLALAMNLAGCVASLPQQPPVIVQPSKAETPAPPPELMQPPRQPEDYSTNVRANISGWAKRLAHSPAR